jgi:hypothetical protein
MGPGGSFEPGQSLNDDRLFVKGFAATSVQRHARCFVAGSRLSDRQVFQLCCGFIEAQQRTFTAQEGQGLEQAGAHGAARGGEA